MSGMDDTYKTASQELTDKRHDQAVAAFRAKMQQRSAERTHQMNRDERRAAMRKAEK